RSAASTTWGRASPSRCWKGCRPPTARGSRRPRCCSRWRGAARASMNLYSDNPDLTFQVRSGIPWGGFVPLWEQGFRFEDGPRSLEEALQVYEASLQELGEFAAREIAPRAAEIDREGVAFRDGRVVQPAALLANVAGLRRLGVLAP